MTEAPAARLPYHTIGHATLALEDFMALLQEARIELLVDVRAFPRSRTNPQFNEDTLPAALAEHGIDYLHLAELGGRRGRQPGVAPEVNGAWDNESFHHYADYTRQPAFRAGLERLRALGQEKRLAIMCAESVWWRCHRRIIADQLLGAGEAVRHILADRVEDARLTPFAQVQADGSVTYPAPPAQPCAPA